jgi:hypothetical protein
VFGATSAGLGYGVSIFSLAFTVFMTMMELLVAFIQAYVFTFLSAMYIRWAIEDAPRITERINRLNQHSACSSAFLLDIRLKLRLRYRRHRRRHGSPGAGIGIGRIGGDAVQAMARQPEAMNDLRANMILAAASGGRRCLLRHGRGPAGGAEVSTGEQRPRSVQPFPQRTEPCSSPVS